MGRGVNCVEKGESVATDKLWKSLGNSRGGPVSLLGAGLVDGKRERIAANVLL